MKSSGIYLLPLGIITCAFFSPRRILFRYLFLCLLFVLSTDLLFQYISPIFRFFFFTNPKPLLHTRSSFFFFFFFFFFWGGYFFLIFRYGFGQICSGKIVWISFGVKMANSNPCFSSDLLCSAVGI